MKNFTNNFKQFTSRLSARWLIMALMLLLGTSSAWGWTIYFVNNKNWSTVNCYAWTPENKGWPGVAMIKESYKIDGYDVYKYSNDNNSIKNCIFNNGSGSQTGDLSVTNGKYYYDGKGWIDYCTPQTNEFRHANSSYTSLQDQPTYYPGDKVYFVSTIDCCLTGTWSNNLQKGEEGWWTGLKGGTPRFYMTLTRAGNFTITNMATNGCTQDKNVLVNLDFTITALSQVTNVNGTASGANIVLTWNHSANHSNVMVVRYPINETETIPAGGKTYSAGNTLGEGTVVYVGADEKYTDSNLSDGVSYKYYFYTVNNNYYSSGVSIEVTTCTNPDFAIQASETVTKGEQITASITGEHTPLVTWSSSDKEVATIDANGNITAHKGGETTITATTTGDGGFCENVPQSATLTVKETPRVSITGENTICEGQTVTLTASITDLSDGNEPTINWYKEGEDDIKKTGATYEPESTGKYYVIVTGDYINRTESGKFQFTVNENPTIQSTLDNNATNVEICGTGNETTLSVTPGFASYSWGDGNTKIVNETGTYTVTATDANGCTSNEVKFNVKVLNPTVEFVGDNEQTVCPGATANFEVVLAQGQSVSWKDADGAEVSTSNPFTQIIEGEAGTTYTYKVVISEGSCSSAEGTVTATIPAINLTVGSISGDNEICSGNATTLTLTGMVNGTVEKWLKSTDNNNYSDVSNTTTTLNTGNLTTSTYYKALVSSSVCPNHKEPTEAYLITVNPLPTISISGNEKAVFYEDVTLTATATQGTTVKWYEGGEEKATGTTYVVTSSSDASKTVTAKAFLNGCESDEVSHTIKFSDEVCKEGTKDEEVIVEKTKILCKRTNSGDVYCYIWGNVGGKEVNNAAFPGVKMTEVEDGYKKIEFDNKYDNGKFNIIFNNGSSGNNNQTGDNKDLLESYIHKFTYNGGNTANYESGYPKQYIETIKVPTPAPITAPAVKMVSAEYNETTDKIDVVAAIYKRGCDDVEWGFQYSEDGTTWSNKIYPNSHTATVVGEVNHSFSIDGGEGNTYYIRAYAKNSNSEVTSANTKSVEIPSSIIESATISLVDSEGNESTDTKVCPQSTVYLKVSYVGGDFKSFEAADNFPGTNLEKVSHDKANNYAIFSYTATSTGVANITISNENTSVTPETGVSITVKEVSVATPPTIYLEKNTICDDQTTNVVVNSPIIGFIYSLKNGSVGDPVTCESEDLKFSVSKEGSYTVQVQETVCGTTAISAPVDLRVITSDVKITLTTDVNEISPWQPLTLTVKAPSGYDYDLQGLDGMVYTKKGDVYTIKIPRPEGEDWKTGNTSSPEGTATKTFTASIKAGEDTSCSTTTKEVTLVDTEEECLAVGN